MDFRKHNEEVKELWDDYHHGCNHRVPILISADEQFRLPLYGCTFKQYYQDVKIHIDAQLKTEKWIRENVLHDAEMGLPEYWTVSPSTWMAENEFFGSEIVIQEDDYSWGKPIPLSKRELLKMLREINVEERIKQSKLFQQYEEMKKYMRNMKFCGRPVKTSFTVESTHGIFTKAAEIRGLEQLCIDFYEDPDLVIELLEIITELIITRIKTWNALLGSDNRYPTDKEWGLADDSLTLISEEHYRKFVLPYHQKIYSEMSKGKRSIHLCGKVQHLFKTLHDELGITIFNGPGPQINLLQMINEIKEPIEIQAEVAHATLRSSQKEIEETILSMLNDEVKKRVKMWLLGYPGKESSLSNLKFFYECGKKYGKIKREK